MNNQPTYPVRGFLHSLVEGSTNINEAEEAILGFIAHAQDRAWKEGVRVGTTHRPYRDRTDVSSVVNAKVAQLLGSDNKKAYKPW